MCKGPVCIAFGEREFQILRTVGEKYLHLMFSLNSLQFINNTLLRDMIFSYIY